MVPFIHTIPVPLRIHSDEVEQRLAAEMSGILAWAVRGWLDCQANGLNTPDVVCEAVAEYREQSDALALFFDDCCFTDADRTKTEAGEQVVIGTDDQPHYELAVSHQDLFAVWKDWASENNIDPRDSLAFREKMHGKGFKNSSYNPGRKTHWGGITLKPDSKYRSDKTGEIIRCGPKGYDPKAHQSLGVMVRHAGVTPAGIPRDSLALEASLRAISSGSCCQR
jgi:putative DNA primase/helicase